MPSCRVPYKTPNAFNLFTTSIRSPKDGSVNQMVSSICVANKLPAAKPSASRRDASGLRDMV